MIIDKNVFDESVQCVQDIATKYNFLSSNSSAIQDNQVGSEPNSTGAGAESNIASQLDSFKTEVKQHAFRVLMLGIFSSGKTAFLNKLLKQPLLTESQAPETTIATELRYDMRNYIEAVYVDSSVKEYSFDQVDLIDVANCKNLVYHLDNPFLQQHSDLILVDMPGIDSSFESHNKAIANYLIQGSAYILLVTAKEGSLRQSLVDFLKEVNHYPQSLACFVSMQDLIMPSDVQQVVSKIQSSINAIFKDNVNVQPISSRQDSDEEFLGKVESALAVFNPQQLFEAKFGQKLTHIASVVSSMLQAYREGCVLDVSEIEDQIKQCLHAKKVLDFKLKSQERQLEFNSSGMLQNICNDLETALRAQIDSLTTAAISGENALQSAISSIIRPVLLEATKRYNEENYRSFIEQLDFSSISNSVEGAVQDDQFSSKLQEIITSFLENFKDKKDDKNTQGLLGVSNSTAYSFVASAAAISTSVLNPIIELILVFLPQIIKALFGKDKESQERERREQIKNAISSQVIPQVISKLKPNLTEAIQQQNAEMLDQLRESFTQLIEAQETALNKAFKEKTDRTESHKQQLSDIDADLRKLQDCMAKLHA